MARSERNARPVTIIDIAKSAGVSKSTVSLVLKKSPLVKEETRQRVTKTMYALGYVYNRGAASLRRSRAELVGMVINDLSNPFFRGTRNWYRARAAKFGLYPLDCQHGRKRRSAGGGSTVDARAWRRWPNSLSGPRH